MSRNLKRRARPYIGTGSSGTYGLRPDEIDAWYASVNRIRERIMRKTPWRHVPGWDGKDPVTLRSI